jgi:DNA gyrase subunit A
VTEGGFAKRTKVDEYRVQGRGGLGIKVAKLAEVRGDLVGALVVQEEDEVLVVMGGGKVVRSAVAGVPAKGRDTMGVIFAKPDKSDRIIAVARNTERGLTVDEEVPVMGVEDADSAPDAGDEVPLSSEETAEPEAESSDIGGSE